MGRISLVTEASNPNTKIVRLYDLFYNNTKKPEVLIAVVTNPNAPIELLTEAVKDDLLRGYVIKNKAFLARAVKEDNFHLNHKLHDSILEDGDLESVLQVLTSISHLTSGNLYALTTNQDFQESKEAESLTELCAALLMLDDNLMRVVGVLSALVSHDMSLRCEASKNVRALVLTLLNVCTGKLHDHAERIAGITPLDI